MYIIFDTETTGFPKDQNAHPKDVDNFPRIIQLGFQVYSKDQELLKEHDFLIKPDGWEIPKKKFWIEHGYNTEKSQEKGVPLPAALEVFIDCLQGCEIMIAHNMKFDYKIIASEMIRYGLSSNNKLKKICTMKTSEPILKLPSRGYGIYKSPNLTELHKHFFNRGFDGAHDALCDVKATAKCFFELTKIKDIKWEF